MATEQLFTIGRAVRLAPNDGKRRLGPPDIQWSIEAATETFGVLGIKGSGKSTTGRVIVEGLTANGAQCVIIDPTGVWWGLKASRSGDKVGFPFTVIGGPHADIPLMATQQAGAIIAELVVNTTAPLIIDLSEMRKGEQRRFMLGFAETLFYKSHGSKAIHLVIDECDLYVPQKVMGDVAQLVGAIEDIVKRGRVKGLGVTLISQRSASINKDVLTQISVLIAHRISSPQDRKAIDDWVEVHADQEQRKLVMSTLHQLPNGTAWFWSPDWSATRPLEQIAVRQPITFDSSATPKAGHAQIVPKNLAQADVEALTAQMSEVVAEAEKNDVRALRARITSLERANVEIAADLERRVQIALKEREPVTEVVVQVIEPDLADPIQVLSRRLQEALEVFGHDVEVVITKARKGTHTVDKSVDKIVPTIAKRAPLPAPIQRAKVDKSVDNSEDTDVTGPMRKLMIVLATHGPRTKRQLALQAGYAENGGAFGNPLGRLRALGYVNRGEPIGITPEGRRALGNFEALPRGRELVDHWLNSTAVTGPMAKILSALIDAWPHVTYSRDELAELTGYAPTGGAFGNPLGRLRTLGLVNKGPDIALTEEFGDAIS